ncbi:MAG TPA: S53 family peptidase [Candidatus Limnocylindrales bacterium]|nr:S53 family peptidase [Candidatus Limnocylindrales bacterium]
MTRVLSRFVARAGLLLFAVPALAGGGASAAVAVSHGMTPAVGSHVRYQLEGSVTGSGAVLFGCQLRAQNFAAPRPWCYGPDQIRAAYDVQSLHDSGITGAGRTIVIVDAFQSPTLRQDLALFDAVWGIPDPTLNIIAPDGLTPFNFNDGNMVGWSAEISLDVEWAHVIAPGATIDLVLAKDNQDANILSATRFAVDHNLGDVISQSFGEGETCMDPAIQSAQHQVFQQAVDKGITLFASSGDQGAAQPTCDGSSFFLSASTPATDPNVTAVGGTNLFADAHSGAYQSEVVWQDGPGNGTGVGGGGFSTLYGRPGYQAPFQKSHARGVPDVSYDAGVWGGVIGAWGVPFGVGAFFIFGGTSAGSPQWAGIAALADQQRGGRIGAINKGLYHLGKSKDASSAFHDTTVGTNTCGPDVCGITVTGFAATPGWDAATGLGSPDVAKLLQALK